MKVDVNRLKPHILSPYPGLNQVGPIVRDAFVAGDGKASQHLIEPRSREVKERPSNSRWTHVALTISFWKKPMIR